MPYTFDQIIELAQRSGIPNNPTSMLRPGARTKSGKVSHHANGHAVDFWGENQDALAQFFMGFPTLEVFHYSKATGKWYGTSKGKAVNPDTHKQLVEDHTNHLHVAMAPEQLGPGSILDNLRKGLASITAPAFTAAAGALSGFISAPANLTEAVTNVGAGMRSLAESAMDIGAFAKAATKIFLPTTQLRIGAGFLGIIFTLIGIWFLSREIRESKA